MKKPKPTRAEQLARHRRIFLLARERGVTLKEAEQLLARQEWEEQQARLASVQRCGRGLLPYQASFVDKLVDRAPRPIPDDAPWMYRD